MCHKITNVLKKEEKEFNDEYIIIGAALIIEIKKNGRNHKRKEETVV